jgi:hypothetical protein
MKPIELFLNGNDFSNFLIILPRFFLNVACAVNENQEWFQPIKKLPA